MQQQTECHSAEFSRQEDRITVLGRQPPLKCVCDTPLSVAKVHRHWARRKNSFATDEPIRFLCILRFLTNIEVLL